MDNQNKDQQQLLENLQKDYDLVVTQSKNQMAETHVAKEYTFSLTEKRRLLQQETIKILVQNAIDDIINMSVLPRLQITPSEKNRILYDPNLGRLTIFSPKDEKPRTTD